MKRFLVWLFTDALSVDLNGVRYVPDWDAIGAIAGAAAAAIGLAAIWYSLLALRRQLKHQEQLEAKHLEQDLLLRVMDLAQAPYDASHDSIADIVTWRLTGGPSKNPEFLVEAGRRAVEAHRLFSTATAAALSVLRRSRPRRFQRGTEDRALEQYDDLIQRVLAANARMFEYAAGDWSKFDIATFQSAVGSDAFDIANILRRVTGDLLARMYSDHQEWRSFQFAQLSNEPGEGGRVAFEFVDEPPLGTKD